MSNRRTPTPAWGVLLGRWGTLIGLLALVFVFSLARPDAFPTPTNFRNIIEQTATLAMVATTVTFVMVTGDFDLSVGALASLCGVVAARVMVSQADASPNLMLLGILAALSVAPSMASWLPMSAFRPLSPPWLR